MFFNKAYVNVSITWQPQLSVIYWRYPVLFALPDYKFGPLSMRQNKNPIKPNIFLIRLFKRWCKKQEDKASDAPSKSLQRRIRLKVVDTLVEIA